MIRSIFGFSMVLLFTACTPKIARINETVVTEQRQLDTLVITAPATMEEATDEVYKLAVYNPSDTQVNDLLHTKLTLRFDWEKEQVIGQADLKLKPYFYPTSILTLDAIGFQINSIKLGDGTDLKYDYDDRKIHINLPKNYNRSETYQVLIDYIATPRGEGGSKAITSDKGLFFINADGQDPNKPQQIWTQGETENNSRWFPTIDNPNERCTQEMYLTVQDKFVTLSNGLLVSSTNNEDGTRTDYWNMDQPHAPYLFMLTVGEFAVVKDEWENIPVNYYVEKEYEADAKAIFPHTPEMLSFFSEITGVHYPWQKYSQVIVRDYVSGAMENTTAVIFGDFIQQTERELIDGLMNDKIVAHEMMHHWFGDYVTCENWANLTLNEGFANYSEYLWLEHKFGRDEADFHLLEEWDGYLSTPADNLHPLIYYGYDDKEDMFDAHSYNKGGSILHMLRTMIGDDAFTTAYQKYLEDNAYSAVEVDELRMAFEDVTGQDLNWFFNQWFHKEGHPQLDIEYAYDDGMAIVHITQMQNGDNVPAIFQIPATIDVYMNGQEQPVKKEVMLNERVQTFRIPAKEKPALITFDSERSLLAEWEDNKTDDELIYQFRHAPKLLDRFQAITQIEDHEKWNQILPDALHDAFHGIRQIAVENIDTEDMQEAVTDHILYMAENETHSEVRSTAIMLLANMDSSKSLAIAKKALNAKAYNVQSAALQTIYNIEPKEGLEGAKKLENEEKSDIIIAVSAIYAAEANAERLPYFEKNLENVDGYTCFDFYENYVNIISQLDIKHLSGAVKNLENLGTDMKQSPWRRIGAMQSLNSLNTIFTDKGGDDKEGDMHSYLEKINAAISALKAKETNPQLKAIYENF